MQHVHCTAYANDTQDAIHDQPNARIVYIVSHSNWLQTTQHTACICSDKLASAEWLLIKFTISDARYLPLKSLFCSVVVGRISTASLCITTIQFY